MGHLEYDVNGKPCYKKDSFPCFMCFDTGKLLTPFHDGPCVDKDGNSPCEVCRCTCGAWSILFRRE